MLSRRAALALLALSITSPARAEPLLLAGVRHDGTRFEPEAAPGWKLVYFGYAGCPDVCPVGLQTMSDAIDRLRALGERVTPVFVTVDPERDTPKALADYVAFFHPRMIGLSPTQLELESMARAWRVKYAKVEIGEGRPYLMDHTASVFLVDARGELAARFPHDLTAERMAGLIQRAFERR